MPDFTPYNHPVLAGLCPPCCAAAGICCRRPSGHRASDLHLVRKADRIFIAQHGDMAAIIHAASGWLIGPLGRARD